MSYTDMQKHPSSLAVLAEIFVGWLAGIGGNFSKGIHWFSRICVEIRGLTNNSWRDR
jgi:hypothetical protein